MTWLLISYLISDWDALAKHTKGVPEKATSQARGNMTTSVSRSLHSPFGMLTILSIKNVMKRSASYAGDICDVIQ